MANLFKLIVASFIVILCDKTTQARSEQFQLSRQLQYGQQHSSIASIRGGAASQSWGSAPSARIAPSTVKSPFKSSSKTTPKASLTSTPEEDEIATKEMIESFLTRDNRNKFIARVYAILSAQLLSTAAICVGFGLNPNWARAMRTPGSSVVAVPMLSLILSSACWFWMCMSPKARRDNPTKWGLLVLFTLGEAISVGFLSSFYKFQSVVSAMGATALATIAVSVYTILQKNPYYDLTEWGAGLSSCGVIFLMYGVIGLCQEIGWLPRGFLPYNDMLYSAIGACLFALYLAYHTRLIVGGKHTKFRMSDKDYVFGAMSLYNDVINMFIYLLKIMGEERE